MNSPSIVKALQKLHERDWWCITWVSLADHRHHIRTLMLYAHKGNKVMFTAHAQDTMSHSMHGDAMCEILSELYQELDVQPGTLVKEGSTELCTTWDDFEHQFLDWTPERALQDSTKRVKWSPLG